MLKLRKGYLYDIITSTSLFPLELTKDSFETLSTVGALKRINEWITK